MKNVIRIAIETTDINLDCDAPAINVGKGPAKPYHVGYHLYDALCAPIIKKDSNGKSFADFNDIEWRLAESIKSNKDYTKWKMKLKENVISHFDNELTADDIKWTYSRIKKMRAIGMWRAFNIGGMNHCKNIKITGKYTLEFVLNRPNEFFPRYLCFATGAIIDSKEASKYTTSQDPFALSFLSKNACGFGPWKIIKWNKNILELRPRINGITKIPIDSIIYKSAVSRKKALKMFENKEVDILAGLYPDEALKMQKIKNMTMLKSKTNHSFLELNKNIKPFNDQALRQLVQVNIDRKKIVKNCYFGFAEEQKSIFQPNSPEYNEDSFNKLNKSITHKIIKNTDKKESVILAVSSSKESLRIGQEIKSFFLNFGLQTTIKQISDLSENEVVNAYVRADCSHGICDKRYDIALDFAPPMGMPGRIFAVTRKSADFKKLMSTKFDKQKKLLEKLNYDILSEAETIPLAGHNYLILYKQNINKWIFTQDYLPMASLMWSAARYVLAPIR
ncbi:MAG: ABC-type transport system, substrate-binding protein [Chloroflexi bacterium]|jgi:ABC-type transport system substrate-binding protein|nr:MAG: ABC-type transport system, substrate-binding protein [Chloroflexota bacterium]|tara:strand:- start:1069 stop:2583 length:1515 start_codon:yes stop_codon:yes gene_type:complete